MTKKENIKKLDVKGEKNEPIEKEVEGMMNAIKNDQVQNGIVPKTSSITVHNFAGKKTIRDKSLVFRGKQYWVKKGTDWKDIDTFFIKKMSFSDKDFE